MVLIHELGHYVAAKILKFKVIEFSVGFGPALLQKKTKSGEKFSFRIIPLGGYCAFETEDEDGNEAEKSFYKEKPWKRIIVLLSGALFNIISAVIFSFMFLLIVGTVAVNSFTIGGVTYRNNGEAYNPNFQVGDIVTHIGGREVNNNERDNLENLIGHFSAGDVVDFTIIRNGQRQNISVVKTWISQPSYDGFGFTYRLQSNGARIRAVAQAIGGVRYNDLKNGDIIVAVNGEAVRNNTPLATLTRGVRMGDSVTFRVLREVEDEDAIYLDIVIPKMQISPAFLGFGFIISSNHERSFVRAITGAIPLTFRLSGAILRSLGGIFTGGTAVTDMAGPVGTVTQMAQMSHQNWQHILILLPLLASNLAIFNLLPLPALDGSKIIFTIIEWIKGKPVPRNIENMIHLIGMAVLLLLVISIDVLGFFARGSPSGWIRF